MTDISAAALEPTVEPPALPVPANDVQLAEAPANKYDATLADMATPSPPAAPVNKYDAAAGTLVEDRTQRLRATVMSAQGGTPDAAAKAVTLARKTGMPADMVERNLPEVEQADKLNKYDELLKRAPNTATWLMQDPINAKVASADGDVEKLGFLEWTANELYRPYLGQQASSNLAGMKIATRKTVELDAAIAKRDRGEYLSPFDKAMIAQEPEIRDAARGHIIQYGTQREERLQEAAALPELPVIKEMQKAGEAGDWGGVFSAMVKDPVRAAYVISLQGAAMLPWQIAGYAVAGIPGAFASSFGLEYMGAVEDAMKASGVNTADPSQVVAAFGNAELMAKVEKQAATKAAVIGAFDAASMKVASVPLGFGKRAVTKEATNIAAQVGVQGVMGGAGEAGGSIAAGLPVDPFAVVSEVVGEIGGAPMEVAGARWKHAIRQDATSEQWAKFQALAPLEQYATGQTMLLDKLVAQANDTKLATTSPEKLQEFMAGVSAQDATVFIPAEAVQTYMQDMTGLQADAFAARLGIGEQLARIAATGEDVAIPLAMYITGAREAHAAWRDQVRTEVDGFSVKQAQEWEKAKATELKALQDRFEEHVQAGTAPEPQAVVYQRVLEMAKANGYTNEVAAQHAALFAARYAARAARNPAQFADALDAFERAGPGTGVRIQTVLPDGTRAMGPDVLDAMLNSIRSGTDPIKLPKEPKAVVPAADATILKAARRLARGWTPEKAIPAPQSLTDFVRKNGGLRIDSSEAGDIRAADLAKIPGLLQLKGKGKGRSADVIAQAAMDAGFRFGQDTRHGSGVDVAAFLKALEGDATGRAKAYPDDAETAAFQAQQDYFNEFFRWLKDDIGWDPKGRTAEEVAKFLSQDDTTQRLMVLAERVEALGPDSAEARHLDRELERIANESLERLADEFAERDAAMADNVDDTQQVPDTAGLSTEEWDRLHGEIAATIGTDTEADGRPADGQAAGRGAQGARGDQAGDRPAAATPQEAARARRAAALATFQANRRELADALSSMGLDVAKMSNAQVRDAIAKAAKEPAGARTLNQSADKRELVAVHNLSAKNLAHAQKVGGIAAPSMAVIKGEHPFDGFGEISLIASRDLIDPRVNAASKVFGSDVYSARYPKVNFKIKWSAVKALQDRLAPLGKLAHDDRFHVDADRLESDPIRELEENPAVQAEFLIERGLEPNYGENKHVSQRKMQQQIGAAGLADEFNDHVERVLASLDPVERIFKGHTDRGARYIPHTIQNVLREMTRTIRDAEGFNYGVGSIRSKVSRQFKSIEALKKADHLVVSKEDFAKVKEEVNNEFVELANEAQTYNRDKGFGFLDAFSEHLKEIADGVSPGRVLSSYYDNAPAELGVKMADFLNKLRNMPTEYFEAKIKRAVSLDEFAGAVVPDDVSPRALKILADNGITDIKTYKRNEPGDRARAVREFQDTAFFQESRGSITFADNQTTISLFQARDLSTLAHETGHLWLAELEHDVKQAGASDQMQADWQAVQGFLGSQGGYITREQHELFARAFETYLMEGKAPSEGLRGVFRSFKNWLVSIYRNLARLQAPISPEMREVFDRLIATDEEIAAARDTQGLNPVFTDAKSAGMTDAEFAAYTRRVTQVVDEAEERVLEKTMASIRRQRTKEVAAEKAKIRKEVTDALMTDPGQAALHFLRNGTMFAGETPGTLKGAKLSRDALVAMLGQDGLKNLPASTYVAEGGIDPDVLAETFGLGNGQELVERLMQLQAEQDAMRAKGDNRSVASARIAEETQKRLTESLGDPLNDGSIEAEAMAAVHSDKQGALMSSELKVLARKAKQSGAITLDDIKAWVENTIAEMSVYQATQHAKYQRAERMAGQKVQRALIKGDFVAAFKAKQDQMVNFALYQEAKKAADDTEGVRKLADRYASADTIKSMDQGALEQIHQLLEDYDFKKRSGTLLAERTTFAMWAAEQVAAGFEVIEPPRLKGAQSRHYSQMTMEEIRGVGDTIKQMAHIGRWKQSMIDDGKRRDFQALVDEAVDTAGKIDQRGVSQLRRGTTRLQDVLGDVGSWFRSVDAALLKMETIFEWLDGDKTGKGIFSRVIFRRVADAQVQERDLQKRLAADAKAIYDRVPAEQSKLWSQHHVVEDLGAKLNKSQMIAVALNMGNESNMQKMLQGEKWAEPAVRAMLDKHLSKEEWQFVQDTWNLIESLWPQTEAMERRINGVAPPKVEALPVETPHGTLRGGYYPMAYDRAGDVKADRIAAMGGEGLFDPEYRRASTRAGSTHKRVEGFNAKVLLSLNVIGSHLNEVAHDLAFREVVMDAFKFLSNDRVREAIRSAVGPEYEKQTLVWLKAVANEWAIDRRGLEGVDKFLQTARANTAIVGMGFRVSTMLSQTAGFANSVQRLGSADMLRGLRDFYRNPFAMKAAVHEKSGEMRNRANDLERDIRLALQRMEGKDTTLANVRRFAFRGIALFDGAVSLPTWMGAYNKGLRDGMTEAEAVAYGDKMVRDTQGAGSVKDLSAFQRGSEPLKLLGMFYSYFNVYYNRQRGLVRDFRSADSFSDYMDVVAQGMWLMVVPTLLAALLSGQGPDDDEDWWVWASRNVGFGVFSGVPWARDVANAASNQVAGKNFGGAKLSPIQGIGEGTLHLFKDITNLVQGKETSKSSIKNSFNVAGLFTGLPLGQVGASSQFVWDALVDGTQNPEGLLDWMKGLAYGPKPKK